MFYETVSGGVKSVKRIFWTAIILKKVCSFPPFWRRLWAMQHLTGGVNRSAEQRLRGRNDWAACLQAGYAFLLAFIFPFICWGRMAHADHPHPGPHFVFASPPGMVMFSEFQPAPMPSLKHGGHLGLSPFASDPQDVAGQSTPDTLSFFFLFLVASGCWLLYTPIRRRTVNRLTLGRAQYMPGLPLPPPRPA